MKLSIENWCNDIDKGKTGILGEKSVSVPLRPPQTSHGLK
jgi:hypothetical protein